MKTVLMEDPQKSRRWLVWFVALTLIAAPLLVLCWMAYANSQGDGLGMTKAYWAAVVVLAAASIGAFTFGERKM